MIIIAKVAIDGSKITESTKEGHVTYSIENWEVAYYTGGGMIQKEMQFQLYRIMTGCQVEVGTLEPRL